MPRILIADDHILYRRALRSAIECFVAKTEVFEADTLEHTLKQLDPDGSSDLALIDLSTPGVASFETLRSLHECYPKTRLAAMAAFGTRTDIVRSLDAGLYGFISKSQSDNEIVGAIKDMFSGRIYVPVLLTRVDDRPVNASGAQICDTGAVATTEARLTKLTPRQREVLPLLVRGMSNKEIARTLRIAEGTTKIHASGLLRVLGARNRTEAAAIAGALLVAADQPISELKRHSNYRRR